MRYIFKEVNDDFARIAFEDGPDIDIIEISRSGQIHTGWTTIHALHAMPASVVGYNADPIARTLTAIKQGEIKLQHFGSGGKELRNLARKWNIGAHGRGEVELIIDKFSIDY